MILLLLDSLISPLNNLEDISLKRKKKGQENMEKIDDRCWGLLSNGFVEAQAHPQSLDHHVDGGFGVSVFLKVWCHHCGTLGHCISSPEQGCCANMRQGSSGMASCQRERDAAVSH